MKYTEIGVYKITGMDRRARRADPGCASRKTPGINSPEDRFLCHIQDPGKSGSRYIISAV